MSQKIWLIKDQNLVTGPFSQEEVAEQLAKGQLSPFAMARRPQQVFWGFLAGYPEFAKLIDSTKLTQLTTTLYNKTTQATEPIYPPPSSSKAPSDTSAEAQSVPYQVITEKKPQYPKKLKPVWGFAFVIGVLLMFSALGAGYYFWSQKQKIPAEPLLTKDEGQAWFLAGHYRKALKKWQNAPPSRYPQKTNLKLLQFQLKNDISMVAPLLQETKGGKHTLIQALSQLKTGDFRTARQSLTKLIQESASQDIKQYAFANMALISAKEKQCDFFKDDQKEDLGQQALIHFLFAFCLLSSSSSPEDREKAKGLLEPIAEKQQSYYQEALLGLAYIQIEEGTWDPKLIQNLLDIDPYLTNYHYYSILIDRSLYTWPELLPLCKKIYNKEEHNHLFVSLYAYCLSRAHFYKQALSLIKKAEAGDPESALIKSLHAHIANSVHLKNESARILGYALKLNLDRPYVLPLLLQARFCEQSQNWSCAYDNWRSVIRHDPYSLSGLGGIAYTKYKQGYPQEAKEYMEQGLALSKGALYSPLLFLKQYFNERESS